MIKLANNNSIYKKIEDKGNKEAQEILNAGQQKAAALEKSVLAGYEAECKKILDDAKQANDDLLKTTLTQVEQLAKQKALFEKKESIEKAVEGAHKQLLKISDQELTKLVLRILSAETIQGTEALCVSKDEHSKYQKLFSTKKDAKGAVELDVLNQKLGGKYHLTLAEEPADINGGFIIRGKSYDIDHSYTVLLENIKEEYEAEIAKLLFGKGA